MKVKMNIEMISNILSDKILKEAFKQQNEIVDEENEELNDSVAAFSAVEALVDEEEEEDIDEFAGFTETQSQFDDYEDQINEDDERLLEAFLSKDAGPQCTLGDVIVARIKEQEATASSVWKL